MMGRRCADAIEAVEYLQRRITEQEDQEPRQKYVRDLQLIHDRKKNEVCVPILPGHDQEAWFTKLDSNGIWTRVFEFLSDPSDVTSAYFACETFRKHLEEKRKMMMLSKVFGVLRDTGRLQYWGFRDETNAESKEKNMESREVLEHRLVSKAWRKSAEEAFLVPPELSHNQIQDLCNGWSNWDWSVNPKKMVCRFRNGEDVDNAIAKLRNPNSCAPLVRLILVDDTECEDKETFYSKLVQFLTVHGENVWGLCFFQDALGPSKNLNYEGLCRMVARMPHLKAMFVHAYWNGTEEDFAEDEIGRFEFKNSKAELASLIARKPFPGLPELQCLGIYSFPAQCESFVAEIAHKAPNLHTIFFSEWDIVDGTNVMPDLIWNELRKLRVKSFRFKYSLGNLCIDTLLRVAEAAWPLESLFIGFADRGVDEDVEFDASSIFAVLSKFNNTLVKFKFDNTGLSLLNDPRNVVVDFPKLKDFCIVIEDILDE